MLRRGWLHFVCLVFIATTVMAWPDRHQLSSEMWSNAKIETQNQVREVQEALEDIVDNSQRLVDRMDDDQYRGIRIRRDSIESYSDIPSLRERRPFKFWLNSFGSIFPYALPVCILFIMAVRRGLRDFFAGWIRSPYRLADSASFVTQVVVLALGYATIISAPSFLFHNYVSFLILTVWFVVGHRLIIHNEMKRRMRAPVPSLRASLSESSYTQLAVTSAIMATAVIGLISTYFVSIQAETVAWQTLIAGAGLTTCILLTAKLLNAVAFEAARAAHQREAG